VRTGCFLRLAGYGDVMELFPDGHWPSRRFGVEQKGVVRPCDDNRESRLNDTVDAAEAISPDTADMPATVSSLFYELLGSEAVLMGGCDDWKKAYRQIPTSDPSRSVVALWDPDSKQVVYFVVWGHCFGQLSAVNSFNAVSKFLTRMSCMFLGHAGGNYFDDHFTVETDYMAGFGQKCLNCLAEDLGFLFDPAMAQAILRKAAELKARQSSTQERTDIPFPALPFSFYVAAVRPPHVLAMAPVARA